MRRLSMYRIFLPTLVILVGFQAGRVRAQSCPSELGTGCSTCYNLSMDGTLGVLRKHACYTGCQCSTSQDVSGTFCRVEVCNQCANSNQSTVSRCSSSIAACQAAYAVVCSDHC